MPNAPLAPRVPEDKKKLFRSMMDGAIKPAGPMMLWKTNQGCNFRCRYCFCPESELSREHSLCGAYSPRHIARSFDDTGKEWTILMTGGEPFLYPDFIGLCRELSKKHFLALNTNLSTSQAIRFADEIDPRRVALVNSAFHAEELERRKRREAFLRHVRYLQGKEFPVCVEYVVYPPLFRRLDRDLQRLEEEGVRFVNLKVFRGTYQGRVYPLSYSSSQKGYFQTRGLDDREADFIDKKFGALGRLCQAGRDFMFMDIAGDLRRCPGSARSYGNLFAGRCALDGEPRPCPFPRCFSPWVGRDYSGGAKAARLSTLGEVVREGLPFLLKKGRVLAAFQSLRNHLRA